MTKDGKIDFDEKFHPEFNGWMWEQDDGIWVSCITSKEEWKGNFLRLLEELKSKYAWIRIPTPSNRMVMIAMRNGFEPIIEWNDQVEEDMDVLIWKKEK